MKIEITTTPNAVEKINMIIKHATDEIHNSTTLRRHFDCDNVSLKQIESFRKSMLNAYLKKPAGK